MDDVEKEKPLKSIKFEKKRCNFYIDINWRFVFFLGTPGRFCVTLVTGLRICQDGWNKKHSKNRKTNGANVLLNSVE